MSIYAPLDDALYSYQTRGVDRCLSFQISTHLKTTLKFQYPALMAFFADILIYAL